MCGVAGVVRFPGLLENDEADVRFMMKSLHHRGPDGHGFLKKKSCALAQTRLALLDLRTHDLPYYNPHRKISITYNGEIYNHREIRRELAPFYDFKTQTDTEVVLAAYSQWGAKCVDKLDGMFAFFIWNENSATGFAARDRLGIKPFFYVEKADYFAFASEASVLVQSNISPFKIHEHYLAEYFTAPYFSGARITPFENIKTLAPGETLEVGYGYVKNTTYFSYQLGQDSLDPKLIPNLEKALEGAVQSQLQADSEIGLFLSGGLDSTLLAALAKKRLSAWTINFPENVETDFQNSLIVKSNDLPFAQLAAQELGLHLHEVTVTASEYKAALLRTLQTNDLICAWEQEISQNILAAEASRNVKAVLVGDAADETHFGYPFVMKTDMVASPLRVLSFFGSVPLRKSFMKDSTLYFDDYYRAYAESKGHSWEDEESQRMATSRLIVDLWLRRLLHNGDIHTMYHSLEARVPFAQNEVLKIAQTLRPEHGPEKSHLRAIASRYMNSKLAQRPKSALTKNLKGGSVIHELFVQEWHDAGDVLSPFVDMDQIEPWTKLNAGKLSDRQIGLEFRILAAITWWKRYI